MVGNFIPSDGVPAGTPADGQYEIMYSTGGGLFASADVGRQATGMFTSWIFEGNVWTVHAALWLDHWALTFHVADALAGPAESLAATYQDDVVGPLGLVGTALMFCVFSGVLVLHPGPGYQGHGRASGQPGWCSRSLPVPGRSRRHCCWVTTASSAMCGTCPLAWPPLRPRSPAGRLRAQYQRVAEGARRPTTPATTSSKPLSWATSTMPSSRSPTSY